MIYWVLTLMSCCNKNSQAIKTVTPSDCKWRNQTQTQSPAPYLAKLYQMNWKVNIHTFRRASDMMRLHDDEHPHPCYCRRGTLSVVCVIGKFICHPHMCPINITIRNSDGGRLHSTLTEDASELLSVCRHKASDVLSTK